MKKIVLTFAVLLFSLNYILSQQTDTIWKKNVHEASFDFGAFYTNLLSDKFYGGYVEFKYYPFKRFGTGFLLSASERKITNTFSYTINKPVIAYYEIGWVNQFDLVLTAKVRIGLNLNNGIAIARLGDDNEKEKYWTKYGYRYRSKGVATNYFYLLEPGIDISYRVFSLNHYPDFYLTAKAKYRKVFGDSTYGKVSEFSNTYLGLGFSIIGFLNDPPKKKE